MDTDVDRARREAASWLILLDEDPGDEACLTRFRAWLDAAPGNAAAWRSVARTGDLLAMAAGNDQATATSRHRPGFLGGWRPVAVALAVAACLLMIFGPALTLRLQADHRTETAEIETLRLEDGSTVRLGPDSAIRLAFVGGERKVELLAGEALFDVAPDKARPFRVVAGDTTVTVLGTRFDVSRRGDGTSVAVGSGHVRVGSGKAETFDLRAGDWVRVGAGGAVERGADLPDFLVAGPDIRVAARNRPVSEIVDRIRPWFGGRIVIADGSVGRQPVTGVFDASDPVRALEALVVPQGGRVIKVTPWLLVVAKG